MSKTRCAIYTRKSSEEGLDQDFNSLDAQHEACAAYIASQRHEGWVLVNERYDDGGISGGHLDRPALQRLMDDVEAGRVDRIVVYKIDRLTRSLTDFAKLVERLDGAGASFVSVTQSFNTATSMGRLTLNVLLSFAQFEREVTAERIRDKIAASKAKGLWMGGNVPLGYEAEDRALRVVPAEAETVRMLFDFYETLGSVTAVTREAVKLGLRSKRRIGRDGTPRGGSVMGRGQIHHVLSNPVYAGRIRHKDKVHEGQHAAIIDPDRFDAIQTRLKDRSAKLRNKPAAAHLSPLAGKIFDETGDRLTPSHACKEDKRYRYYVSRRLVTGASDDGTGWRLPADRLERDLASSVQKHLVECIDRGDIVESCVHVIGRLRSDADALGLQVLGIIGEARLRDGAVAIDLDPRELARRLQIARTSISSEALSLRLPFRQRRRGVESRLVIGVGQPARGDILISNIARASAWREALCKGEDLATIAARDGITIKYLGQMLVFAFLSPKLVRAILQGRQQPALTTNWIRRHGLPASWAEQDRILAQL
ncbi:recombinase family protein [Boseongicola aestuarii]|uniref:DNA-invertase hin n=1 Tax=Boseongicola aestuarii TaxID=1470561 RepID=A0A238J0P0_9RHOB|nr:recombinase family protein [Boseongicola aestuarii]SMX24278.1 DNA-invertase hin [Boseongicola aestuarii]